MISKSLCSERHADSDFRRSLGDVVRDDAIKPDGRKHQRGSGKQDKKSDAEATVGSGLRADLREGAKALDGQIGIQVAHDAADTACECGCVTPGMHNGVEIVKISLEDGLIDGRFDASRGVGWNIANDSDDLKSRIGIARRIRRQTGICSVLEYLS